MDGLLLLTVSLLLRSNDWTLSLLITFPIFDGVYDICNC